MKSRSLIIAYTALLLSTPFNPIHAIAANVETIATTNTAPSAERGKITFDAICAHCHHTTYEDSSIGAPGLRGVLERHDTTWLNSWIQGPETFAKTNEAAKDLISSNKFGLAMPTLPAMQDETKRADIIEYLKTLQ